MSSRPLRVCLVSPVPPPYGGIGHWTQMILRHAHRQHELSIHLVDVAPRWRAIDDLTVWKRVVVGGATMIWHVGLVIWQLVRGCRVVHINTPGSLSVHRDLAIIAVARLFRVPVVYHIRFGRVPQIATERTPKWRLMAKAMSRAHTVVAIDQATEQAIRQHLPTVRVIRIPNCIDSTTLPHRHRLRSGAHTVLYLGWVIPTKGIAELMEAWGGLRSDGWRLQIAGPGDGAYQRKLAEKFGAEGIEFLGEQPHAQALQLMADADVFVLPSYTEGFPNVIAESMALGLPIVATGVGAIPEMLAEGRGIVIPPREVEPLREALARAMASAALRGELGTAAQAYCLVNYALPVVFDRLVELWRAATVGSKLSSQRRTPSSGTIGTQQNKAACRKMRNGMG